MQYLADGGSFHILKTSTRRRRHFFNIIHRERISKSSPTRRKDRKQLGVSGATGAQSEASGAQPSWRNDVNVKAANCGAANRIQRIRPVSAPRMIFSGFFRDSFRIVSLSDYNGRSTAHRQSSSSSSSSKQQQQQQQQSNNTNSQRCQLL